MPNLTTVGVTNGIPSSGTGTVSTLDGLMAVLPANGTVAAPSTNIQSVQVPRVATSSITSVNSSASSGQLLAANTSRLGLILYNTDANTLYVKFGSVATTALGGYSVAIPSNGTYIMGDPVYNGRIDGIWTAAGAGGVNITEL